jgi:hypothetical protein
VTYGSDSCAIDVRVQLPRDVAHQVEKIQKNNPEVISRLLVYGYTRQVIFDVLAGRLEGRGNRES